MLSGYSGINSDFLQDTTNSKLNNHQESRHFLSNHEEKMLTINYKINIWGTHVENTNAKT